MKIITLWHARLTLFIIITVFAIPLTFAFGYAIEQVRVFTPVQILLAALGITFILATTFAFVLLWRYRVWSKTLRLNYRKEYAWAFLVAGFGAVGSFLMIDAFFEATEYFLLIIIPMVIALYYGLYQLGRLIFHVPLFMRGNG